MLFEGSNKAMMYPGAKVLGTPSTSLPFLYLQTVVVCTVYLFSER